MERVEIKKILAEKPIGQRVKVCGWVRTGRDSKNTAFIEINDGSTLPHLQIVVDKEKIKNFDDVSKIGTALRIEGICVVALANQAAVEINAESIEKLGGCPTEYPLQKKRHTLEYLRTMPHLRLRTNTFNAVFRMRSFVSGVLHEFFQSNGFVYVNTPIITGSDCEGAGDVFNVTTNDFNTKAESEEEYYAQDFFGKKAGLSVSGQLEGEACAMAFGKIYTFGPSFRAENSSTTRHLAEFWHIEPEIAFADLNDVLALAEQMFRYVISRVLKECAQELKFFEAHYEKGLIAKLENVIKEKFAVCDYAKAIEILRSSGEAFVYPPEWGCALQTEHERYIAEKHFNRPVFVTNYPKDLKAYYMKQNPDGKTVAASDLLVPGIGEIIGSSEREADYDKLISALKSRNINQADYENYLELRKFGSCPHGGFGLGLERFMMYISGMSNIRDVTLYPRAGGQLL